jgi:hypothetical protein
MSVCVSPNVSGGSRLTQALGTWRKRRESDLCFLHRRSTDRSHSAIFLAYCWAYVAAYNPMPMGLRTTCGASYYIVIGFVGFGINVFCACLQPLPSASSARKLRVYLPLAVVSIFLWGYWPVLGPFLGESWSAYVPRALSVLLMLPVAALFMRRVTASA